jgi:hypothetical protein
MNHDLKKQLVDDIYSRVLHVANRFLHQAKNFNLSVLQLENPSYAEISAQMTKLAHLIQVLCDDIGDCHTGFKAHEYCNLMVSMASAITNDSQEELQKIVTILNGKPFI